jgi:hypothetical protein
MARAKKYILIKKEEDKRVDKYLPRFLSSYPWRENLLMIFFADYSLSFSFEKKKLI